jgi:hypothetical protein
MKQWLFAALFIVALIVPMAAYATLIRDGDYDMRGKYQGLLFCSDCPGVWTEVTLEDNGTDLGNGRGTFVMTERYSGGVHRGETVVTTGTWSAISRDAWQTSGLLKLQDVTPDSQPRYFLCDGGRRLRAASPEGTWLTVHMQQSTLTRVIPPQVPNFGSLRESDANHTIYGRVGDRFSISLLPTSAPGATANPRPDFTIFSLVTRTQLPSVPPPLDIYGEEAFVDIVAANPGTATLTFQSRSNPARFVTFDFRIEP